MKLDGWPLSPSHHGDHKDKLSSLAFLKPGLGTGDKLGSSCLHRKNFTSEAISLAPASF